jgi:hypothetical protein
VKVTRFDPTVSLIVITARILGPRDEQEVSLARLPMPVARLTTLGFAADRFRVHAHDLPASLGIQGLLGLSVLRGSHRRRARAGVTAQFAASSSIARSRRTSTSSLGAHGGASVHSAPISSPHRP